MKYIYKILVLTTVISILLTFSGCFDYSYIDETADSITSPQIDDVVVDSESIKLSLPYISSDALDPLSCKTEINRSLTPLLFDSLFGVDNNFKAFTIMAESYKISDGKLTVSIKNNLIFSDLGSVSANDVVDSFEKAKKSDRYKNALSHINGAVSTGTYTVVFDVDSDNEDLCSLLTFPIIKIGSEVSSENKTEVPIGCGRYILSKDANNMLYLTANSNRHGGYEPVYKNIGLVATNDEESVASTFSLGHTNVLIDSYSDGVYQKYIGASNKHNMSNIVYLVLNSKNKLLEDANVRKSISVAINREDIADYSFISFAKAAYTPFHPDFYRLDDYDLSSLKHDTDLANSMLDSIGYTNVNPQYNFRFKDGGVLEFDLIVNKDNPFKLSAAHKIKEQLSKVSIYINLRLLSQDDFLTAVKTGNYDMYLGECKLTDDLDLSVFFAYGNSASEGIAEGCNTKEVYNQFKNGEVEFADVVDTFNQEMPFIPLLYRCGSINSNSAMAVSDSSIVSDYYYNIDKWKSVND